MNVYVQDTLAYYKHLESCHLHMNGQTCTYTSEACTYHVYTCWWFYVHTCTCIYMFMFFIIVCSMYIHVYAYIFLYIHGTYTYLNIYICTYHVYTRSYSFTTTRHFLSGPISLATPASLSSAQASLLQSSFLLVISLLNWQTTQARLATSKLP